MTPLEVFIGWDPRDDLAARVCKASIERHASVPVSVRFLKDHELRREGWYDRPYAVEASGQMIDGRDFRPFSTQFSFTRFLTPHLATGPWCLFVDADFLFRADVADLFAHADDDRTVLVVQHDHRPDDGAKMDGVSQAAYPRKNWSSLMLINVEGWCLNPPDVKHGDGRCLHGFDWLDDAEIGALPRTWNWLCDQPFSGINTSQVKAVHFTTGTPDMIGNGVPFAHEWLSYL